VSKLVVKMDLTAHDELGKTLVPGTDVVSAPQQIEKGTSPILWRLQKMLNQ
jgi:hypothetical protein